MVKGVFYLTLNDGCRVNIFGQCHSLVYIDEKYDNGEWFEYNREQIDKFYLTGDERGRLFQIDDLKKMFNPDDCDWDYKGVSYEWSGINEEDDSENRRIKYMNYKSKFEKLTSKEQFEK